METIIKQSVGIDCSKDELALCFGQLTPEWKVIHKATSTFANTAKGYKQLVKWSEKLADKSIPVRFVVEATGVYHESMTNFLFDAGKQISVVLPNKARHFAQTLKVRTVNDKESSKMLATLGLEKQLDLWQKPDPVFAYLKQITREREQLVRARTIDKNQLHAEQHCAFPGKSSITRVKKRITMLNKQVNEIEKEIASVVKSHPELQQKINKVCTINGVGLLTVVTVVAETNGFNDFRNSKQLVSYAGYDVVEKQSGTSVHSKTHISGKGNKHIRRALHFPALTSVQHNEHHRNLYTRIESKSGIKMKGYTAVQRKLLVLIYTLWKKDEVYDPNYHSRKTNAVASKQSERKATKISIETKPSSPKKVEQPIKAALHELDHVRSCFSLVNAKVEKKLNRK